MLNNLRYVSCDFCGRIADEAVKDIDDPQELALAMGYKKVDGKDICSVCLAQERGALPDTIWPVAVSQTVKKHMTEMADKLRIVAPDAMKCLSFYGVGMGADPNNPKTASALREVFVEVQLQLLARLYAAGVLKRGDDAERE